ncbi:MAG: TetR/AcrR family transcriptional regulator [Gemmatimonadaceae bacterium]|nr:TetR/AcrR family transcriptional regulator [Gemmatimonadaceae bacterium]
MTGESGTTAAPRAAAAGRILEATSRAITLRGAADVSLQDVAEAAGVSKALIHYHFRDKGELLARLVEWLRAGVVARQDAALAGVTSAAALDALWAWLADELQRGDLRVLLDLALVQGVAVQAAVVATAQARRESAAELVARLHVLLGLKPRVPASMIADTFVAFVDGIALDSVVTPSRNPRIAFDVFWLAILGLAD